MDRNAAIFTDPYDCAALFRLANTFHASPEDMAEALYRFLLDTAPDTVCGLFHPTGCQCWNDE